MAAEAPAPPVGAAAVPRFGEPAIAPSIGALPSWELVVAAVYFNDQPRGGAVEVDDARVEQHDLSAKPDAELTRAQLLLQRCFCRVVPSTHLGRVPPQLVGVVKSGIAR